MMSRPIMSNLGPTSWYAIGAVAAIQTLVLSWMVYDRVSLLRSGREMIAEVLPVDPRDLFRGDYVIFGYSFNSQQMVLPEGIRRGDHVYVTLKPKEPGQWEVVKAEAAYPASVEAGNFVLRALAEYVYPLSDSTKGESSGTLRYGIESYFVPEGTGRDLEKMVADKKIAAVIAVGADGKAAIKALMIDGERVVEEPLL
jgi:uncharacterized membrane-anchored protein